MSAIPVPEKVSSMKFSLRIALTISLLLTSCAKKPVTRVTVKVPDAFSGYIHLRPCIPSSEEPVVLNRSGYGNTAACPAGDVEIVVIKETKSPVIPPKNVLVRRRGDGEPISISSQIP